MGCVARLERGRTTGRFFIDVGKPKRDVRRITIDMAKELRLV
jgi:phage anti-repressor protein